MELHNYIPYLMRRIISRIEDGIALDLVAVGINYEQWRVLLVLNDIGPLPLNGLAEEVSINLSTLSRLINRMIAEGLVSREPSGVGRAVRISNTPLGLSKVRAIVPIINGLRDVALESFSTEEIDRLKGDLRRLYQACDAFAGARIADQTIRQGVKLRPLRPSDGLEDQDQANATKRRKQGG